MIAALRHYGRQQYVRDGLRKIKRPRFLQSQTKLADDQNCDNTVDKGFFRLLNDQERDILKDQRELTSRARQLANQTDQPDNELSPLDHSAFCVVLAGEFNAGKSTLLNALLGEKLLETGSLPTTDRITLLSHSSAKTPTHSTQNSSIASYFHDLPLLEDLTLVDTPGTNAVWRDHTATTMRLLPKADLVLFCTSADRPFPESERQLLESLTEHRKAVVVLITKMDVLDSSGGDHGEVEKRKIVDFVTQHAGDLLGSVRPVVIPISARDALAAKLLRRDENFAESAVWKRSNFGALEDFLRESLTTSAKIKSKLSNPIGLAEGMIQKSSREVETRKDDLSADVATLNLCSSQLQAWQKQLEVELERAQTRVQSYLVQHGDRGKILLRRMSMLEWFSAVLLDRERLDRSWAQTLPPMATLPVKDVETIMTETAESLATQARAQGQAMVELLGHRPVKSAGTSLVGSVTAASRFEETRQWLDDHLNQAARKHLDGSGRLDDNLFSSWRRLASATVVLSAVGLGTGFMFWTETLDLITSASLVSGMSVAQVALLTHGRQQFALQYREEWQSMAEHIVEDMAAVGAQELERVDHKVRNGIAPYTRFVEAEQERLDNIERECQEASLMAQQLRNRINKL